MAYNIKSYYQVYLMKILLSTRSTVDPSEIMFVYRICSEYLGTRADDFVAQQTILHNSNTSIINSNTNSGEWQPRPRAWLHRAPRSPKF